MLDRIGELVGRPVGVISVGPDRAQTLSGIQIWPTPTSRLLEEPDRVDLRDWDEFA